MLPSFDLQGGASLVLARDASVTGLLSAFGTVSFRNLVAWKAFPLMAPARVAAVKRMLLVMAQGSIAAALLATALWLVVQAGYLADADTLGEAFAAVPTVLAKTSFGHVIMAQLLALFILAATIGWRDRGGRHWGALSVACIAVALQSGHSHAYSMVQGPSVLLSADILHLLGAGGWLGGLVPLLLLMRMAPADAGAQAARWFSPLGQWCIGALVVSAALQGWVLVASIPGLIGTAYGWMALVKLALFGVLFGFAWLNRYRFAPALLGGSPASAKRVLLRSILLQTGVALAIVVAAVVLSALPPSMHVQAVWPFDWRFSLAAINEDPDFRREVLEAVGAIAAAVLIVVLSLVMRRFRVPALALAILVAWFALPHMELLLVSAYPTSFYHSPTGFTAATILEGSALYARNCVSCHGAQGRGDGPVAASLPVLPADLTAGHLWMHSDGEIFWWISDGILTPEGARAMPGFADTLDEESRWALIDYIRAHNAGFANGQAAAWKKVIQAPGFGVRCGAKLLRLWDLRGRFVRLALGTVPPDAAGDAAVTIIAMPAGDVPQTICVTRDETVPAAYGIVAGVAPGALAGMQFLIDDRGLLRAMQRPSGGMDWNMPRELSAEIERLRSRSAAPAASPTMPMDMKM